MSATTVDAAISHAIEAYDRLIELAEELEDEWTYVNDLAAAWRDRLAEVAAASAGSTVDAAAEAAIERVIDEIDLISDPHRAIDWLSTFPQVTLLALGEAS